MRNVKEKLNSENGAVQIVEATFVFPIMFIILFFLIYMGNAHYVKSQVESVAQQYAIQGASYCADPILSIINKTGKVPSPKDLDAKPYRYIFGGMNDIESDINKKVINKIKGSSKTFFNSMEPHLTNTSKIAKYNNYIVYSTFSVEIKYSITFPIKFLGKSTPEILTLESRAEVPVEDTAEFIRNTDMVIDYFHGTKLATTIEDAFAKINDFIDNFNKK